MSEWSQWLTTLRDDVRSLHTKATQPPKRVVMTNGDWSILFLDPDDAFVQDTARTTMSLPPKRARLPLRTGCAVDRAAAIMARYSVRSGVLSHIFAARRAPLRRYVQKPQCFTSRASALDRQRQQTTSIEGEDRSDKHSAIPLGSTKASPRELAVWCMGG